MIPTESKPTALKKIKNLISDWETWLSWRYRLAKHYRKDNVFRLSPITVEEAHEEARIQFKPSRKRLQSFQQAAELLFQRINDLPDDMIRNHYENSTENAFCTLPTEILLMIAEKLDPVDQVSLIRTSRSLLMLSAKITLNVRPDLLKDQTKNKLLIIRSLGLDLNSLLIQAEKENRLRIRNRIFDKNLYYCNSCECAHRANYFTAKQFLAPPEVRKCAPLQIGPGCLITWRQALDSIRGPSYRARMPDFMREGCRVPYRDGTAGYSRIVLKKKHIMAYRQSFIGPINNVSIKEVVAKVMKELHTFPLCSDFWASGSLFFIKQIVHMFLEDKKGESTSWLCRTFDSVYCSSNCTRKRGRNSCQLLISLTDDKGVMMGGWRPVANKSYYVSIGLKRAIIPEKTDNYPYHSLPWHWKRSVHSYRPPLEGLKRLDNNKLGKFSRHPSGGPTRIETMFERIDLEATR